MILCFFPLNGGFPSCLHGITLQKFVLVSSVAGCSVISVGKSLGFPIEYIKGITPGIFPDIAEKDLEGKSSSLCPSSGR